MPSKSRIPEALILDYSLGNGLETVTDNPHILK